MTILGRLFRWDGAPWDWAILASIAFLLFLAFAT